MVLCGYVPNNFIRDRLWRVAREFFEKDIMHEDSDEAIGAKSLYLEPGFVALSAAIQFDKIIRESKESYQPTYDAEPVDRLREILQETRRGITVNDWNTISVFYHSLVKYPHGFMSFRANRNTDSNQLVKIINEKIEWVEGELGDFQALPQQRLKNLMYFCFGFAKECANPRPIVDIDIDSCVIPI